MEGLKTTAVCPGGPKRKQLISKCCAETAGFFSPLTLPAGAPPLDRYRSI